MSLVLDASVALAWLIERESEKERKIAGDVLSALAETPAIVPALWHSEIVNALLIGQRRGVLKEATTIDFLERLSHLPVETDEMDAAESRNGVLALAKEHRLTAYDATYLELALRSGAKLATFDRKLGRAMQEAGGEVIG